MTIKSNKSGLPEVVHTLDDFEIDMLVFHFVVELIRVNDIRWGIPYECFHKFRFVHR